MTRLASLNRRLQKQGLDAFVISNISNVRYLSGFSGSTASMLVKPERAVLITDFRYQEQAAKEVNQGIEIVIEKRDALTAVGDLIAEFRGKVGFESDSLTYGSFEKLAGATGAELVAIAGAVEDLRGSKDEQEIGLMSKAVQAADRVFETIVEEIRPGMTEVDIAARIDFLLRKEGTDVAAFRTIVASGPNASLPHAQPGSRAVREGDLVTMDFGAVYEGYCSDMTRTVVIGKASDRIRKVYGIVLEAQEKAISVMRAGMECKEADRVARSHIEAEGFGENFGHGLGHGVGLEVHEAPRLSFKSDDRLERGMVVTVEPGIYIPGWGGVRIEDVVVIEDGGCRDLTCASKELLELGLS